LIKVKTAKEGFYFDQVLWTSRGDIRHWILNLPNSSEKWPVSVSLTFRFCMEPLLKGKIQYNWPPCTNLFKTAVFNIANTIYFLTSQAILMRRSTVLIFSFQLAFPGLWQFRQSNWTKEGAFHQQCLAFNHKTPKLLETFILFCSVTLQISLHFAVLEIQT
jgi:hypothetical protein